MTIVPKLPKRGLFKYLNDRIDAITGQGIDWFDEFQSWASEVQTGGVMVGCAWEAIRADRLQTKEVFNYTYNSIVAALGNPMDHEDGTVWLGFSASDGYKIIAVYNRIYMVGPAFTPLAAP